MNRGSSRVDSGNMLESRPIAGSRSYDIFERMPYIKQNQRPKIDEVLKPLIKHLKSLPTEDQDGSLNYAITKILKNLYPMKYFHLNRALGVLTAVKEEFYRVVVGPYEDTKIKENGEVN